jgi:hypothetical protein
VPQHNQGEPRGSLIIHTPGYDDEYHSRGLVSSPCGYQSHELITFTNFPVKRIRRNVAFFIIPAQSFIRTVSNTNAISLVFYMSDNSSIRVSYRFRHVRRPYVLESYA